MADRTVRAIFEARVSGARKGMADLSGDVDKAGRKVDGLTKDLKGLDSQKVKPKIDVAIDAAQKRIKSITLELGDLRTMEVTPQVTADIKEAQKRLRDARSELRDLNSAKATMRVDADTSSAKKEVADLGDDIRDESAAAGGDAGENVASGIVSALRTIPIAGAVIGVGAAIAGGILVGIVQGLSVERERDLFSARTGLDEDTSARFGRSAGEAYANAWGESVAANLDTARLALQAGIIDSDATDAEIQNVIEKLTGIQDLFDYDIQGAVQAVGNAMKTGLVKDADQAFDLIVASSQKVASDDLLETINEYSNQFVTMGLTAEEAFGLIVQGAKAGARDTDKVADTLKEMGLRIREGTDPAKDALKALGLNAKEIVKAFQKGGPDATDAIDKVFDALRRLESKGGNTQAVIAALFGGAGEDLGAALYALDIDKVSSALGGVDGAAGAAERALNTLGDNTATKIESARRNVEVAMNGIKGALAEAFGDDIASVADWVSKNRAPLLEFFLNVIDGAFEMGGAFLEFSSSALNSIADVIDGMADLVDSLPGDQTELKRSLNGIADGLREGADSIDEDFIPALDRAQSKASEWAAPELLKARIHDATLAMTEDMDAFEKTVKDSGGTVTINGDKKSAEDALKELTNNINGEDGTVTINGDKVPAEDALDVLMALINASAEDVKVGADVTPADAELDAWKSKAAGLETTLKVDAATDAAERALDALEKTRYAKLEIRVAGVNSVGGITKDAHEGGWTGVLPGRHSGGLVPGSDPGYDNVLWPLYSGGRTLQQPLAGGEYVVNSKDAAANIAILEAINSGYRPAMHTETNEMPVYIQNLHTNDAGSFRREVPSEVAWRKSTRSAL